MREKLKVVRSKSASMAPKKSSRALVPSSQAAADSSMAGEPLDPKILWVATTVEDANLDELLRLGLIPDKSAGLWRLQSGRVYPEVLPHMTPVFTWYFYRGLSLPICLFLRGLLHYYGLDLLHLNPNSITQLAVFVHLCEAYLGIPPHFHLWRFLYYCKGQSRLGQPMYISGAGFQLHDGMKMKYLDLPLLSSNKGWHDKWFLMENSQDSVPAYAGCVPMPKDSWLENVPQEGMKDVQELMDKVGELKNRGLTGMAVAVDFVYHGIQPLKDRVKLACFYSGVDDPTREVNRPVTREEIAIRVKSFFTSRVTNHGAPKSFSVYEPPSENMLSQYVFEPPYPEELSLKSRRSPGVERASASPAGAPAGEMPADFYAEVGGEEHGAKDVPALSKSASEGTSCRTTRQATRKRKAAAAAEPPKVVALLDEDEVESDGETLDQRRRRVSTAPSGAALAATSPGAPAKPVIRIVRPKIRLPSASEVIPRVVLPSETAPVPRLEICPATAGALISSGGEGCSQPVSESSTRGEEASGSKVVESEVGPVAAEPGVETVDTGVADHPEVTVTSLSEGPEHAKGSLTENRDLSPPRSVPLLLAHASAGPSPVVSEEVPECIRGVLEIYAENMRLKQETKAVKEKYGGDDAKAAQSLRIIKAQGEELTELRRAKAAAESDVLTLRAQLT